MFKLLVGWRLKSHLELIRIAQLAVSILTRSFEHYDYMHVLHNYRLSFIHMLCLKLEVAILNNLRNRRLGGCVYVLQMFFCFLFSVFSCFFSVRQKNMRQPFSGTAERIFMKLLPNDSGENWISNAVPKWGLGPRLIFWGLKTTQWALGADTWQMTLRRLR